jgi:hypothetical protein
MVVTNSQLLGTLWLSPHAHLETAMRVVENTVRVLEALERTDLTCIPIVTTEKMIPLRVATLS